jgi:hypothetical protein
MMNGKKNGCRTADIQGGAVRQPGKQNFPLHDHATKNQNGCSSLGYKNFNFDSNPRLEKLVFNCSFEKLENCPQCGQSPKLWQGLEQCEHSSCG